MKKKINRISLIFLCVSLYACASTMNLNESTWQLDHLLSEEGKLSVSGDFSIVFDNSKRATGKRLCNNWGGTFTQKDNLVIVKSSRVTKAACKASTELEAQLEKSFLPIISKGLSSDASGRLTVKDSRGNTWVFTRK